jgi:hypothetical protein
LANAASNVPSLLVSKTSAQLDNRSSSCFTSAPFPGRASARDERGAQPDSPDRAPPPLVVAASAISDIVRFVLDGIAGSLDVATNAFDGVTGAQQREPCGRHQGK